jgi:hypothetical protein
VLEWGASLEKQEEERGLWVKAPFFLLPSARNRGGAGVPAAAANAAGRGPGVARVRGKRERGGRGTDPPTHLGLRWGKEARPRKQAGGGGVTGGGGAVG